MIPAAYRPVPSGCSDGRTAVNITHKPSRDTTVSAAGDDLKKQTQFSFGRNDCKDLCRKGLRCHWTLGDARQAKPIQSQFQAGGGRLEGVFLRSTAYRLRPGTCTNEANFAKEIFKMRTVGAGFDGRFRTNEPNFRRSWAGNEGRVENEANLARVRTNPGRGEWLVDSGWRS